MNSNELVPEAELLGRVVALLEDLGPFSANARREDKWRTTEQIANELDLFGAAAVDHLDRVLREHEAYCLVLLEEGLPSRSVIRRAKYPDRTTALPLWGSVKHHGPPWRGHRPDRYDPPEDIPSFLAVPESAPHVFLSHTHQDSELALRLAKALASMEIGAWRFETHIEQQEDIADCVRDAILEAAALVALVTRHSIASLWVLTELHTSLETGQAVILVIDADDPLLLRLFQSVRFPNPDEDFDLSVEYDREVLRNLKVEYSVGQTESRVERYEKQAGEFLATLPRYLGNVPPKCTKRVWRAAIAFPHVPSRWSAFIKLASLPELPKRLETIEL